VLFRSKLLAAFRDDPGNYSAAARLACVQRRTARRAYEIGYPDRPWGLVPIKDLLAKEAELARSRLQLEADQDELDEDIAELDAERDREASRQHAVKTKEQEGQLIASARAGAILGLVAAVKVAPSLGKVMARIGTELEAVAENGLVLSSKEIHGLTAIMRRYSTTLRELALAGQTAMEMERLYLGEPSQIIGVKSEYDEMPLQDLVKLAGYQDGVLKRAQERGLVVLEGGLKKA